MTSVRNILWCVRCEFEGARLMGCQIELNYEESTSCPIRRAQQRFLDLLCALTAAGAVVDLPRQGLVRSA